MILIVVGVLALFALCVFLCKDLHKPIPPPPDGIGAHFDGFSWQHTPPPIPPKREAYDDSSEYAKAVIQHQRQMQIWTKSFYRYQRNYRKRK